MTGLKSYTLLSTALVAAGASVLPTTSGHTPTMPLAHYLATAKRVGPNLYQLGQAGHVLLAEGCAYHVETRLNLRNTAEVQAVPGILMPVRESDGRPVCHKSLMGQSARPYGESKGLYRLGTHPFVVFAKPDGCEMVAPGLYDPHTQRWTLETPTKATALLGHDGAPNCRPPWVVRQLETEGKPR